MKKRKHKRRRKHGLSSNAPTRRRRRSRGLMDGIMSGANLKNSAMNSILGAAGGGASVIGNKLMSGFKMGTFGKIAVGFGVGLVTSALGAPKVGIGYSGGQTALALSTGVSDDDLNDDAEFADDDVLSDSEVYLSDDGEYVRMLNDGSMEYLSDDEIADLEESGNEVYPQYSTMNSFQH